MAKMNYCPKCATSLSTRFDGGRERTACPAEDCNFIHFGDFSIGCAGVVLREESGVLKALLVQRGQAPFAGTWQIPGGYAEHDEVISVAVEREVAEEAGVVARVNDLIAFRHALAGSSGGPSTNVYMIFRLDYVEGEPQHDGDEIAATGFFSLEEIAEMEGVQRISKWAIHQALTTQPGSGLSPTGKDQDGNANWQVFGLDDIALSDFAR
ncbi:MAG: NUDIX domain-containing protein [Pseudomonadota bacterium]